MEPRSGTVTLGVRDTAGSFPSITRGLGYPTSPWPLEASDARRGSGDEAVPTGFEPAFPA